jgi:hypothetical protein
LKIAYLLMRWLFGLVVLASRGDCAKDAELLVLRHENAVLRRNAGRVRYEAADRAWFAALAQFIPRRAVGRGLPGDTRDAAGLAPPTDRTEVRHEHAPPARPPEGGPEHRPGGHSPGRGETRCGVTVRAENLVHGSDQRSCLFGALGVMISDHVSAVRVPPDYAGRCGVAAVAA